MADYSLPSVSDLQKLSTDPRTQALAEVPNALQDSLGLADVLQQKRLERQKQIEALKEQVRQHIAEVRASQLAKPITPNTPASTQVPATLGQVANVNPETSVPTQTGPEIAKTDEAKRFGQFSEAAIQAQPKEAIKDIFAEQRADQKAAQTKPQAWKTVGTTSTPDGKKHAVQQDPSGEFRTVEIPAGTELTSEMYPKVRLAQTVAYLNKDLVDSLSLTKAPEAVKRVNNTLAGIVRFKPLEEYARDKGITPQEITEMARNVDAIVSATGRPTVTITKELLPRTAQKTFSSIDQFLSSKPSPQDYREFLSRWSAIRDKEKPKLEQYVKQYQASIAQSKGEWLREYSPQVYERSLKAYGLKPSDIKKSAESNTPMPMFPTGLFGGGTPEEKFNDYKSQGLSDDEAYARIAEEEQATGGQ